MEDRPVMFACVYVQSLALFPGRFEGGGERAWFAHAHCIPNISWNQDTLVTCPCYITSCLIAQLTFA